MILSLRLALQSEVSLHTLLHSLLCIRHCDLANSDKLLIKT